MESEQLTVIRRGLELFNLGEYEAAIETLPPEIECDSSEAVLDGALYRGRDEVLAYWKEIGERWDDFRIETERWIEGDGVVLLLGRLIARGADSGVPVEATWDQVWRVKGDVPVRCEYYSDRERAWGAAGLDPES